MGFPYPYNLLVILQQITNYQLLLYAGTPKHVDYEKVKRDLISVPGVRNAHSLHIWSLTLNKTALAAHLVLGKLVCTASLSLFHMLHILS